MGDDSEGQGGSDESEGEEEEFTGGQDKGKRKVVYSDNEENSNNE